ncbi:MAG: exodeoxyribonuclease V subunit alpha [SAR324 cluster bacterium]|nr:exodeoxyribonuclease V subunit alpha [SAR324 cluster bacterium]MBL7035530.1 exodeoxyribonuclease V subunit alpha [SAR324 cluster bacterium]
MSSSINSIESPVSAQNHPGWSTAGTARTRFAEADVDGTLQEQIGTPFLTESLQNLRNQFADIQLGSEYFFQALELLRWQGMTPAGKSESRSLRFHVQLTALLLMRKAVISGSTCIPWHEMKSQISAMLKICGFAESILATAEWRRWLLSLGSSDTAVAETGASVFVENNSLLYFNKNWQRELLLLSLLRKRLKMKPVLPQKKEIEKAFKLVLTENPVYFGEQPLVLAEAQKAAVMLAVSEPLLIVSGGPGTGKTSVAVTLLRVLKKLGLAERPVLTAPTGRAAKRMSEAVENSLRSLTNLEQLKPELELLDVASKAKTLHRLLGYHPGEQSFKHHEYAPLEHDLLIIDEGSMIDQELMISLLRAANSEMPYQSAVPRIILLGDAEQLPSVGNGAVLQELTAESDSEDQRAVENPLQVVKLYHSYRQELDDPAGRNILGVADTLKKMLHDPQPELLFETDSTQLEIICRRDSLQDVELEKVQLINQQNSAEQLSVFAAWWVKKFLQDEKFLQLSRQEFPFDAAESRLAELNYLFEYLKRFRILTATRVLRTGAVAVNHAVRQCWLAENTVLNSSADHFPGEPVMVSENNYLYQLFNGDQGIFLKIIDSETNKVELKAVFSVDGVFKTFYEHELHHLQTAYATTVHKSQGSEYEHLALILPAVNSGRNNFESESRRASELMGREMLYTALTRAKKSVLILGEKSVLEATALHRVSRYSGLGAALRAENIN